MLLEENGIHLVSNIYPKLNLINLSMKVSTTEFSLFDPEFPQPREHNMIHSNMGGY